MSRLYVTTPIYYPNDAPHIGHAYTTVVGDAISRWHRLRGDEVFFLTGTDEHGQKIQRAAEANGLTPQEQSDQYSARFVEAWKALNIANDDFLRTSDPRHVGPVTKILNAVHDNGFVELKTYEGLYCVPCEAYYTEDDVPGGNCPIHGRPVEHMKEENYFFKLSMFEDRLLEYYEQHPDFVVPEGKRNEAIGFIKQGLRDFSISRTSITWGVPIPWDPAHVTYVWFDALTNYLTAIGYGADEVRFNQWWPHVHHLMAKDIIRFHCVYWPAMLMAANLPLPARIHVHGYLLVGGEKMSKTRLNQILPGDLSDEFGVDGFRYHFLRDLPFGPDGDFSYEQMVARYNSDLANNFGNLFARVATVVGKKCNGIAPAPRADSPLAAAAAEVLVSTDEAWRRFAPSDALEATWRLIRETNSYLEDNEPWKSEPGQEVDAVMGDAAEALRIVALLAQPAMPSICVELWNRLGLPGTVETTTVLEDARWGVGIGGNKLTKGDALFPRKS